MTQVAILLFEFGYCYFQPKGTLFVEFFSIGFLLPFFCLAGTGFNGRSSGSMKTWEAAIQ